MTQLSRRIFIKNNSLALAGISLGSLSFDSFKKYRPNLSFSTLGCPDWSFETIVNFAAANNYTGIEFRCLMRELDLTKCKPFSSPENIQATLNILQEKKLKIVDLGSSSTMHIKDPIERKKTMEEGQRFIDLASQLNCPYVRVYPNNLPKNQDPSNTFILISNGLKELGDYAKGKGVKVLMETHGDLVHIADIKKVMELTDHPEVGLIWDVVNMWSVTKEQPLQVYDALQKYIYHTHIKDVRFEAGNMKHVLFAEGESPIFEAIDILAKQNYTGYYSFEWEKMWHPEIGEPEVALPDFSKKMLAHFK